MKLLNTLILSLLLTLPLFAYSKELININTANKETLMSTIKGVGEKKAEAIIDYRETNGPFESVDDLTNIKGIAQATIDKHREMLTVSD